LSWRNGREKKTTCHYLYRYPVGGRTYEGDRITIDADSTYILGTAVACRYFNALPEQGQRVSVRYDPGQPEHAYIVRAFPMTRLVMTVVFTVAWLIAVLVFVRARRRDTATRQRTVNSLRGTRR